MAGSNSTPANVVKQNDEVSSRVFPMLKASFGSQQDNSLQDYRFIIDAPIQQLTSLHRYRLTYMSNCTSVLCSSYGPIDFLVIVWCINKINVKQFIIQYYCKVVAVYSVVE